MVSQRRSIHSSSTRSTRPNFRPSTLLDSNAGLGGTTPTREPTSVKEIFTLMVLHMCKKSLWFDVNLKVAIYLLSLFLISLIADFTKVPRMYLSRSDNILNKYFVKFAWGWNLLLIVPFLLLSSYVYCCGNKQRIFKRHFSRICIATFFWWFWTTCFNMIEANFGKCGNKGFPTRAACLQAGHLWNGFDLSGHSFILIYGSLLLIEETKCMMNWDSIKDNIRLEEHKRKQNEREVTSNPLRHLSDADLQMLQVNYEKYTPYLRALFIVITMFQIMWDVMLVCTMLYYHIMIEKFLGGSIAILTWFFTYRVWYSYTQLLPALPGDGVFKYVKSKNVKEPVTRRRSNSLVNVTQQTSSS